MPKGVLAGGNTIGIRMSSHKIINEIVERLGHPITATSANISGKKEALTADKVREYFPSGLDYIIEDSLQEGSVASTVVDISQHDIRILREGTISQALAV